MNEAEAEERARKVPDGHIHFDRFIIRAGKHGPIADNTRGAATVAPAAPRRNNLQLISGPVRVGGGEGRRGGARIRPQPGTRFVGP